MRVGQPGFGGNDGNFRGHSPLLYLSLLKPRKPGPQSEELLLPVPFVQQPPNGARRGDPDGNVRIVQNRFQDCQLLFRSDMAEIPDCHDSRARGGVPK